jgi:tryptophan synthase alpha subunit
MKKSEVVIVNVSGREDRILGFAGEFEVLVSSFWFQFLCSRLLFTRCRRKAGSSTAARVRDDNTFIVTISFKSRPALVAYVTCGDPDLRTTREVVLAAIGAGAEVIELGVPFSDPVADGPVIQRASERALKNGVSLEDVLGLVAEIRRESDAGLIVFTYFNPVLRMGMEKFAARAADTGVDGALITTSRRRGGRLSASPAKRSLATIF